ncbi:MAG: glycoside hydrolase family 2 TIM barrel-domain containing protein [Rikenellaceae bacterium]
MKRLSKLFLALVLVACASTVISSAEVYPQITNISARQTTSLDGMWRIIVDQQEIGYYSHHRGYKPNYVFDAKHTPTLLQEYNFDNCETLEVPGDWNTQKEKLYYYEGTIWYRKKFDYALEEGQRLFVDFGAVNYEADVWFNGEHIGHHIGGFTPFQFEITDLVTGTDNSLVLMVNNIRRAEGVPTLNLDWWNYGGITRPVRLVETSNSFVRDYYLQLEKNNKQLIEGWIQLDGAVSGEEVTVSIPGLKINKKYAVNAEGFVEFSFKAKPELWSPENPKLYDVTISSGSDSVEDEIGFRTIRTEGKKILLNDKEIFCRGINMHEETPFFAARAYSREHAEVQFGWIKEMNGNFARLAHYTHSEETIKAAERMGILLWSEIPVYWLLEWENPETYANAENQLAEMITRDKNRCNIVIWSVANETPRSDARLEFLKGLIAKCREMDDVRLVSAAMEKEVLDERTITVNDELSDYVDLLSYNQYLSWYGGEDMRCFKHNWIFEQNKPVFLSEFGAGARYGYHDSDDVCFTEDMQKRVYEEQIEMLSQIEGLAGTTPWILKDFRSPRRLLHNVQDEFNRKGVISEKGERKEAFYVMQEWYGKLAEKYGF